MYFRDFHVSTRGYRHINISAFVEIFFPGEFRTHLSILCNPLKSFLKNYYSSTDILVNYHSGDLSFPFLSLNLRKIPPKIANRGGETNASRFYRYWAGRLMKAQCQRVPLISVHVVYTKGRDCTIAICRDVYQKDLRFSAWF